MPLPLLEKYNTQFNRTDDIPNLGIQDMEDIPDRLGLRDMQDTATSKLQSIQTAKQAKQSKILGIDADGRTPAMRELGKAVVNMDWSQPNADATYESIMSTGKQKIEEERTSNRLLSETQKISPLQQKIQDKISKQNTTYQSTEQNTGIMENLVPAAISGDINLGSKLAQTFIGKGGETFYRGVKGTGDLLQNLSGVTGNRAIEPNVLQTIGEYGINAELKFQQEQADLRKSGAIDKLTGYNPDMVQEYGETFRKNVQAGDVGKAITDLANPVAALAFVSSAPEMYAMATPAGLTAVMGANVDTNLKELEDSNKANGVETTNGQRALSVGLSMVGTYIDRLGDKVMMGDSALATATKQALSATLDKMKPAVRNEVMKQLGGRITSVLGNTAEFTAKTAVEGGTEGIQTLMENKATDSSKMNLDLSQEEIDRALEATGIGLGAGGIGTGIHNPNLPINTVKDTAGAVNDTSFAGLNKLAEISAKRTKADVIEKNRTKAEAVAAEKAAISGETAVSTSEYTNESLDEIQEDLKQELQSGNITQEEYTEYTENVSKIRSTLVSDLVSEHKAATEALTDEEYTPAKDVEVTAKLSAVEKLESLFDKAKNVGLELIKGDSTSLKNVSNKKNKQYRVEAVSDTMITDMLDGKGVSDTVGTESLSGNRMTKGLDTIKSDKVTQIKEEVKRIKSSMTEDAKTALNKIVANDKATDADIARILAIGISAVEDSIVAETNKSDTEGVAREDTLAVQLGKEHINSFGVNVTGKAADVAAVNKERGEAILDFLEQVGIIERNEDLTPVSSKDVVNEEGIKLKPGSSNVAVSKDGDKLFLRTVALTRNYKSKTQAAVVRKDGTIDQEAITVDNPIVSAMKMMNRLFNPVNNEMVSNEGQDVVVAHKAEKEVKLSKEHEDIIKAYSELKYKIKPEFMNLLKELRGLLDKTGADGIVDFDKFFNHEDIQKLLGTNKKVPKLLQDSELGKFIGRSGSLAKLLENLDAIEALMAEEDGFNFHYESAINERIHLMQTVLDFQGDKYMARQMITDGEHTVKEGAEVQMLVKEVASELNKMMDTDLPMEEILELDGIKAIAEADGLSLKGLLKAKEKLGIKGTHSPFKLLSLLQVMKDIGKAYGGSSIVGDIKTSYVVQNDASASGVMNTLMNLSGSKAVQEMLKQIWGIEGNEKIDPYAIVSNKVKSLFEGDKYAKSDAKLKADELEIAIKSDGFMRDLAKYLVMPWFYGQSDANAKKTFGDSVATKLYEDAMLADSKEATDLIIKITGNKNLFQYTKADLAKVASYFAEDLGETYVEAVTESFPEVVQYRKDMGSIFKMLEKTKQWNGSIRSAFAAMDNSKEKMSVRKLKSVMLQDTTSTPLTVNEMLNNETSFKVNLQHGVDASILLKTLDALMKEFNGKDGKPLLKGTMSVHDAIYSTPEVAMKAVKYYNEFAADAAIEYDFMNEALNELEAAAKAMEEGNQVRLTALGLVAELRAKNDAAMEDKKAFLGDKSLEVMGEGGEKAETYNTRKPGKDAKQSETDKARAELKEKFKANRDVINKVTDAIGKGNLADVITILGDALGENGKATLDKMAKALEKGVHIEFAEDGIFQAANGVVLVPKDMSKDPINSVKNSDIAMTPEALVEILAHEIDHAVQLNWIKDNINSDEVKYIKRALDKLATAKGLSSGMRSRISHMLNPISGKDLETVMEQTGLTKEQVITAFQVSEFSSMMNESNFAIEAEKVLQPNVFTALMNKIKDLLGKAYTRMAELLKDTGLQDISELDITMDITKEALRMLQDQALATFVPRLGPIDKGSVTSKATAKDTAIKAMDTVGEGLMKADSITADFLVIWGDAFYEMAVPGITKAHETMLRSSRAYNVATGALNTFVFDSDWMKRLQTRLGIAGDNMEQLQSDMLTEMNDYQQKSRQLAEDLSALKRSLVKEHTEKEFVDIWKIFASTNVADLSEIVWERLLSGSATVEDMLKSIESTISPVDKAKLDAVVEYYATGLTVDGNINVEMTEVIHKDAAEYVALKGLSNIKDSQKLLGKMVPERVQELRGMAVANKRLNDQINRMGLGDNGLRYSPNATFNINYDGTYVMDTVDIGKEVVAVDDAEMASMLKAKGGKAWTVISKPDGDKLGVMVRDNMDPGRKSGVGLSLNRYVNGVMIGGDKAKAIQAKLDKIPKDADKKAFLTENNLVPDGYKFRMLLSTEDKIKHLGMKQDIAESMYRTLMHNKDLMASEGVRQMVLQRGLRTIAKKADMDKLIEQLTFNYEQGFRGEKIEMEPFIELTMPYNDLGALLKANPMLNRYYKIPDNVTSFNGFNKRIQLVQRGPAEILLGHANFSIFNNNHPELAKWERAYKQISSLVKQRMVVLSPLKLAKDTASTVGILSIMGMSPVDIYEGYKKATKDYMDYAKERTKLVELELEVLRANHSDMALASKRRDAQKRKLEGMPFHSAFKAGFIQSQGTSMMTMDADTISGLQKNIHEIINKYTHTKNGDPNTVYKAIKWFQTAGVNVDELLIASAKYASTKNVTVGEAMVKMADILKAKKEDKDVAGYISELLLLPGSTAVNAGGAYMVGSDAIGKRALEQWLLTQINKKTGKKYTEKEAAYIAMRQIIDFRPNMPSEIQALSDYNILLFPAFWMNIQRSLFHLAKSHPISSIGAYGLSAALGQEDTNIFMQNIITKQDSFNGLVHVPMGVNAGWFWDLING